MLLPEKVDEPILDFELWLEDYLKLADKTDAIMNMEEAGATQNDIETFFRRVLTLAPQTLL